MLRFQNSFSKFLSFSSLSDHNKWDQKMCNCIDMCSADMLTTLRFNYNCNSKLKYSLQLDFLLFSVSRELNESISRCFLKTLIFYITNQKKTTWVSYCSLVSLHPAYGIRILASDSYFIYILTSTWNLLSDVSLQMHSRPLKLASTSRR